MDANLIAQTCNQTPYPDLCISTLQSDPRSAKADVKGLGIIMVDAVKAKAREANLRLQELAQLSPYLFTLFVFILFVCVLYGEDLICIFGQQLQLTSSSNLIAIKTDPSHRLLNWWISGEEGLRAILEQKSECWRTSIQGIQIPPNVRESDSGKFRNVIPELS
ncbi:hypothetical protein C1H46_031897 [Malus baccata]|uniref:Pectinesterase inhibitor domain-containing protein n=1 Tax=Malus baccata TaxID=106549 RepID=A0A540L8G4_MALBA|nr:hypothetical protein C1H46_031897 [Malus baccata]